MKTIKKILLALAGLCLLVTCTESDKFDDEMSADNLKKASGVAFVVEPNGLDDTDNLYSAFSQAIDAGPGAIVQLTAGEFFISRPVVVADFNGIFRGAGKDLTKITNLDDVPFPLVPDWPGIPWEASTLFNFYQTSEAPVSIKISDMSLELRGRSEPWPGTEDNRFHQIIGVYGQLNGIKDMYPTKLDYAFESVAFIAEMSNDWEQFNGNNGLQLWAEFFPDTYETEFMTGTYTIQNCSFKNLPEGIGCGTMSNSKLIIGGDKKHGNEFENSWWALVGIDFSNSVAEFSFNKLKNVSIAGVQITQGYGYPLLGQIFTSSDIIIKHNDFHLILWGDGIVLEDDPYSIYDNTTLKSVVSDNYLNLDNTIFRGIYGWGIQDALVKNNTIVGSGLAGITAGSCPDGSSGCDDNDCSGWKIIGNNLEKLDAEVAPIWLGPGSSDCLVVGDGNPTLVLDEGTNNILIKAESLIPKKNRVNHGIKIEMRSRRGFRL
jgi:hypothetical protein